MTDIVIVNPSVNMKKIAREIGSRGYKTYFVLTKDLPYFSPEKIYYFFNGYNVSFTSESQGVSERDDGIFLFKNSLISKFRLGSIDKKSINLNPDLIGGNFKDYTIFCSGVLEHDENNDKDYEELPDISSVCDKYPGSLILASAALSNNLNLKMTAWDTDFDTQETFGKDYFIFFTPAGRVEAFLYDGLVYTIGNGSNHIESLTSMNKTFAKFSFKKLFEKGLDVNNYPWVIRHSSRKYFLVNDYSFSRTSISMPSAWYDKCASYISVSGAPSKILKRGN